MKIVILGGCRCGKTTLTDTVAKNLRETGLVVRVEHFDFLAPLGWSEASTKASHLIDEMTGAWVAEGVLGARALRKWLARHLNDQLSPCDAVCVSHEPKIPRAALKAGQAAMIAGCLTVWSEIEGELRRRGVEIQEF